MLSAHKNLPVFFLGDADIYGFDILCSYCFGSELNVFECHQLPAVHWLGAFPDIDKRVSGSRACGERGRAKFREISQRQYFQSRCDLDDWADFMSKRWLQWLRLAEGFTCQSYELENLTQSLDITLSQFIRQEVERGAYM